MITSEFYCSSASASKCILHCRIRHLLVNLGWVDFDLCSSTLCLGWWETEVYSHMGYFESFKYLKLLGVINYNLQHLFKKPRVHDTRALFRACEFPNWLYTEMRFNLCMWFVEFFSCSCLTVLPGPAWVLLSKTYKSYDSPQYWYFISV